MYLLNSIKVNLSPTLTRICHSIKVAFVVHLEVWVHRHLCQVIPIGHENSQRRPGLRLFMQTFQSWRKFWDEECEQYSYCKLVGWSNVCGESSHRARNPLWHSRSQLDNRPSFYWSQCYWKLDVKLWAIFVATVTVTPVRGREYDLQSARKYEKESYLLAYSK